MNFRWSILRKRRTLYTNKITNHEENNVESIKIYKTSNSQDEMDSSTAVVGDFQQITHILRDKGDKN